LAAVFFTAFFAAGAEAAGDAAGAELRAVVLTGASLALRSETAAPTAL
jgi:hypothetical protein